MADGLQAAAADPSRIPAEAADKASLTTWIAVVAGMIGANRDAAGQVSPIALPF
jgi:hypothetical protein